MKKYYALLVTAAATVLIFLSMRPSGATLVQPSVSPMGIVDLELARNVSETSAIINNWERNNIIVQAERNTYFDCVFILCYSFLLFLACWGLSMAFRKNNVLHKLGKILACVAFFAAAMDVLENYGMMRSLAGIITVRNTQFTFWASVTKWTCIGIVAIYLLMAPLLYFSVRKVQN